MRTIHQGLVGATFFAALTGWAHYTWVSPATASFQAGKTVTIRVSHGDVFPNTDEAINAAQVKLFVVSPTGVRTELKAVSAKTFVSADFAVKETGVHKVAFTQDRGAMSRTPKGVKPGGRDRNPEATEAFTMLRTGAWHSGKGHKPAGLEVELTAENQANGWTVQLLWRGQPLAGQKVQVVTNGATEGKDLGSTNANGMVTWKPAGGAKGPAMFLCEFSEKAPAGSPVDTNRFSTTLFVNW